MREMMQKIAVRRYQTRMLGCVIIGSKERLDAWMLRNDCSGARDCVVARNRIRINEEQVPAARFPSQTIPGGGGTAPRLPENAYVETSGRDVFGIYCDSAAIVADQDLAIGQILFAQTAKADP